MNFKKKIQKISFEILCIYSKVRKTLNLLLINALYREVQRTSKFKVPIYRTVEDNHGSNSCGIIYSYTQFKSRKIIFEFQMNLIALSKIFKKYVLYFYVNQSLMIMKKATRNIKSKQIYAFFSIMVLKYIPIIAYVIFNCILLLIKGFLFTFLLK